MIAINGYQAADEDAAFKRILRHIFDLPGDSRDQLIGGGHCALAGVLQHEAASPVGILGHPRLAALLTEQRCLLISSDAGDRNVLYPSHSAHLAVDLTR